MPVRDQKLHLAPVTLGYDNGYTVEVTSGLRTGELVAMNVVSRRKTVKPSSRCKLNE